MSAETNKTAARQFIERAFNQGDLDAIDGHISPTGIDHQEPPGTDFVVHIKEVITGLRTAFPDLHFEIHEMLAEGDIVAFRSTMTGTHLGVLSIRPVGSLPPTGRKIAVPHMHFIRIVDGQVSDLWHIWDTPGMMRQLGVNPMPQQSTA
jgi:predicted SnoaL-like aldol condensation-catalyzing enzyme